MGTARSKTLINSDQNNSPEAQQAIVPSPPRLLNLSAAASYLGVSIWTIRDLEAAGILPRIRVPLPNQRELRKLLFDRVDLDKLIDAWKDRL